MVKKSSKAGDRLKAVNCPRGNRCLRPQTIKPVMKPTEITKGKVNIKTENIDHARTILHTKINSLIMGCATQSVKTWLPSLWRDFLKDCIQTGDVKFERCRCLPGRASLMKDAVMLHYWKCRI